MHRERNHPRSRFSARGPVSRRSDRTVTVSVIDDAVIEGNEAVSLTLGAPSGGAMFGTPTTSTLTIIDNDAVGGPGSATAIPATSPWSLALLALLLVAMAGRLASTDGRKFY
jgi:hypothetical protein